MNKQEAIRLAIGALTNAKGDDTYRAEQAFKSFNEKGMKEQYGESGKTRQQILDEYRAHDSKIDAAIAILKTL